MKPMLHALSGALAVIALAACQSLPQARGAPFVAVAGFGQAVEVSGAALRPDVRSRLRAVFPATRAAPATGKVIPALDKAARYLNLLGAQGLHIRPGDVVVVVSGPATSAVLNDSAYRAHAKTADANPNLPLIGALRDAGAVVSVCGQAMQGQGITASELAPGIRIDLSAMTTVVHLQSQGFSLIPE